MAAQCAQPLPSRGPEHSAARQLGCAASVQAQKAGCEGHHTCVAPLSCACSTWVSTALPSCAVPQPSVLVLQAEVGGTGKQTVEQPAKPVGPAKPVRPADGTAKPAVQQHPQPAAGSTLFVRGLPPDATPEQLSLRMKTFGALRGCRSVPVLCHQLLEWGVHHLLKQCWAGGSHCVSTAYLLPGGAQYGRHLTLMRVSCSFRLVMNKATNKPKGTAFVEFKGPAGAAKAAKASADARCVAEGCLQYHVCQGCSCCKSPCARRLACTAGAGSRKELGFSQACPAAARRQLLHADLP